MQTTEKSVNKSLISLIIILIIDLVAFTCILPLFPTILEEFSKAEPKDELYSKFESSIKIFESIIGVPDLARYNNVFLGGILGSLFSLLQYVSSPIFGALSDNYGRKPLLLISAIGSLFSYYLWSVSTTFWMFVISRVVGGLSKASVTIAIAIVSDLCPNEQRGRGMSFVGIAFSIAFILGPMIGAYFSMNATRFASDTLINPPKFAMVLTVVEILAIIGLLSETLSKTEKSKSNILDSAYNYISPRSLFNFSVVQKSLDRTSLFKMKSYGFIYFLYLFLYSGLEFTLSFYTHIRFHYDGMHQGRMYFFVGILMIIIQGGYVRRIKPGKHHAMATLGLALLIPAYLVISVAYSQWLFYFGLCLYAIASGIVVPCLTTLVSQLSPEAEKGATMGIFRSLGALSRAAGPVFGSLIFWLLGPECCYALGAVLFFIPLVLLRRVQLNEQHLAKTKSQ
uniref:Major facilitator superfamily (MFS) profile domain-containing protein n=1 Tax=Panagrolaimus sp. JU765 TaxID=591449 RepID=A0AC34Q5I7_9BILA